MTTQAIRAIADKAVTAALRSAASQFLAAAAERDPHANLAEHVDAYLAAVRAEVLRMERHRGV